MYFVGELRQARMLDVYRNARLDELAMRSLTDARPW